MVVPVMVQSDKRTVVSYALLDGGATRSIISSELAERLELPLQLRDTILRTAEGTSHQARHLVNFKLLNLDGNLKLEIENALVLDNLSIDDEQTPSNRDIENFTHLQDVWFNELDDKRVHLILAIDLLGTWLGGEIRRSTPDRPWALQTKWGWTLMGNHEDRPSWWTSSFHMSLEDQHTIDQMTKTIRFDPSLGGAVHYVVGLPYVTSREETTKKINHTSCHGLKAHVDAAAATAAATAAGVANMPPTQV